MDKYNIDSHKLIYHVSRVNDWLNGEPIYPIYMEISPTGACNHRCSFCGLDFMKYSSRKIDISVLKKRLPEFGRLGLKSIMYAGEGEPFLHKDIAEMIMLSKESGIDAAVTSNGVLFKKKLAENILSYCSWIKFSINSGTPDTYAKIHGTKSEDFKTVIDNLCYAAEYREKHGIKCTLGVQILLLPEVESEIELLTKIVRDIGMDYLVVKPYSQHPQSITKKYKDIVYSKYDYLYGKLKEYDSDTFSVIVRLNTMRSWDKCYKNYEKCFGLPFWSYIDAGGNVWGCSVYLNDNRFFYGNIIDNSFQEIWESDRRKKSMNFVENELSVSKCRINCRMDNINKYLWELHHPNDHVNFI
ncbi:putative oxidoreductase [Desulfobacula toluolica Tol2]|uniref:Putative oxidoreductase n=2 Tax=Desulfobacula toluolica TaxID=28223 RepID=K0NJK0_DESTT|nr:putative oxidoreductase [Desulfobacula toluolica Tol2]